MVVRATGPIDLRRTGRRRQRKENKERRIEFREKATCGHKMKVKRRKGNPDQIKREIG